MAGDVWASGEPYEQYVGRWSRLVAVEFVDWVSPKPNKAWVDVGCGTGALTETILRRAEPRHVLGVDPSAGFLEAAAKHVRNERIRFEVGSADGIPAIDDTADYVVSGLMLNFAPDPSAALAEMRRVLVPGGTVAAYVWDYVEGMQMMRYFWDAAVAVDPAARDLDEASRFPLARPDVLGELFTAVGLADVETTEFVVPTAFPDFDGYWTPFLGGQGAAPTYVTNLDEERRAALRERLRAALPTAPDGSIDLTARAWAVRGVG